MSEFQEIAHSGGRLVFKKLDGELHVEFSHSNPYACTMYQVAVSPSGELLATVPIAGIGQMVPYPQPSLLAIVVSDREGLFGRLCPACKAYFRTGLCDGLVFCSYCAHRTSALEFTTPNQLGFIAAFCGELLQAEKATHDVVIDLDALVDGLPDNNPAWSYSEQRQQRLFTCRACKSVRFDILGDYGSCPNCNLRTSRPVINEKLDRIAAELQEADARLTDRHDREVEWEKLLRCVSEFEAMADDLRTLLLRLPAVPRRRQELEQLSFQQIAHAAQQLHQWYGFDFLDALTADERVFLNRMSQRRHVFTHKAGRVDQEYLDRTGDTTVRLHQNLRLRSREIRQLLPLLKRAAEQLIDGFEFLIPPLHPRHSAARLGSRLPDATRSA